MSSARISKQSKESKLSKQSKGQSAESKIDNYWSRTKSCMTKLGCNSAVFRNRSHHGFCSRSSAKPIAHIYGNYIAEGSLLRERRVFTDYHRFPLSGLINDMTCKMFIKHNVYEQLDRKWSVYFPFQVQHRCIIRSESTVLAKSGNEKRHYIQLINV